MMLVLFTSAVPFCTVLRLYLRAHVNVSWAATPFFLPVDLAIEADAIATAQAPLECSSLPRQEQPTTDLSHRICFASNEHVQPTYVAAWCDSMESKCMSNYAVVFFPSLSFLCLYQRAVPFYNL